MFYLIEMGSLSLIMSLLVVLLVVLVIVLLFMSFKPRDHYAYTRATCGSSLPCGSYQNYCRPSFQDCGVHTFPVGCTFGCSKCSPGLGCPCKCPRVRRPDMGCPPVRCPPTRCHSCGCSPCRCHVGAYPYSHYESQAEKNMHYQNMSYPYSGVERCCGR